MNAIFRLEAKRLGNGLVLQWELADVRQAGSLTQRSLLLRSLQGGESSSSRGRRRRLDFVTLVATSNADRTRPAHGAYRVPQERCTIGAGIAKNGICERQRHADRR